MNSNHPTLYFRYEEKNKMKCYTGKVRLHKERGTNCNINDTGISDKPSCIHFVIQKYICSPKNNSTTRWVPTPIS